MKVRNKKTDEIGKNEGEDIEAKRFCIRSERTGEVYVYDSLKKLNEEWEDYEEPKEFWFVDSGGEVEEATYLTDNDKSSLRSFGNYFETKEEAEKAVEKLKAWKRLKELGFRFIGETCDYKPDKHFGSVFFETNGYALDVYEDTIELYDDLDLLFGGEE